MAYSILIVDDSVTIREVLKRTITMTELPIKSFVEAQNGKQALERLDCHWIDLVFTDINMPDVNGIELINSILKSPEFCNIPVVIVSTEGSTTRIERLIQAGVKGYVRKPFNPERIRDLITDILGEW